MGPAIPAKHKRERTGVASSLLPGASRQRHRGLRTDKKRLEAWKRSARGVKGTHFHLARELPEQLGTITPWQILQSGGKLTGGCLGGEGGSASAGEAPTWDKIESRRGKKSPQAVFKM